MVIDVLKDDKLTEDNAYSYAVNDVKMFETQFYNLRKLSSMLRHNKSVKKYIHYNPIFEETADLVYWL